ncbi:unnamed protein product [Paramecium sonneborni]|uniref:Uncharacterized protein n=1 Tax=Paramecium sonneborni TaxID=65129 RepID=A0A8S1R135_9CILI|nr:unnamed protein product [Paramecium sonneborni]
MNFDRDFTQNQLINDQPQEIISEYNGEVWYRMLLIKNKFKVIQNQNEIKYITDDGTILRIEEIKDQSKSIEIMTNFEQIQHLSWYGRYGKKFQKIGKWKIAWKGEILQDAGGEYCDDGKRQGQWKEVIKNYWSKAQVYEVGKYENDKRKGYWKYIYGNTEIDGGFYNEQGYKNGKWIDLNDNYWDWSQVTFHGDYQDNKRIGNWDIKLRGELMQEISQNNIQWQWFI